MNNGGDVLNTLLEARSRLFSMKLVISIYHHYEMENSVTFHKCLHKHIMIMLEAMPEKNKTHRE